ncbi:MAG TPA: formate dehydrogenase accessory sulfurtransferase FdhD [Gemmatimonadales bacterium]|nr:formate dehydrogenase accessory sulfurtransferase FdhD [Gemmatimonadales bacterium]
MTHRTTQDLAAVEETPVWLEVNGRPVVTWMCTPDQLEELVVGWLHGEGYIRGVEDIVRLRPCATDLGFWVDVAPERIAAVDSEDRRRVLASGCGAVSVALADPHAIRPTPARGEPPDTVTMRALFKAMFARGERYHETGGIHAAALTDGASLLSHAEDVGRHNAVDKVIGAVLLARRDPTGLGLLVTGRISAELAFKASRAGLAWVATVSVPTTLAVNIAARSGLTLVGRAVSGAPQLHRAGDEGTGAPGHRGAVEPGHRSTGAPRGA